MPTTPNIGRPSRRRGTESLAQHYPVTAAQTFVVGDYVYEVSGKLSICATTGNDVGAINIAGRSLGNATEVLANPAGSPVATCPIDPANDGSQFLSYAYSATPSSAITAITQVGSAYPLINNAGQWGYDIDNAGTNNRVIVKELHPQYPVGTQYGWAWINVLTANRQLG